MLGTPLISATSVSLRYPIVLAPRHKNNYFKPRESFNLLGMFQNPMMMVMVLTGAMMLGTPYIMVTLLFPIKVPPSRIELEKPGPPNTGGTQKPARKACKHSKLPTERGCQVWVRQHYGCEGICSYRARLSALLAAEEESKASVASGRSPGNGATIQQRKAGKGSKRR